MWAAHTVFLSYFFRVRMRSGILKIVDTFDEATKLYYNFAIDEEKDNTSVTNYNIQVRRTNYYECLLEIMDYYFELISPQYLKKEDDIYTTVSTKK